LHDIVGADAMLAGKAKNVAGVRASGNTLTVTLKTAAPDFLARSAIGSLCAVPPSSPADPGGMKLPPAAGPYYVAKREVNRYVELRRNPYYHGPRPHRVDRIEITTNTNPNQSLLQVEKGEADYDSAPLPPTSHPQLAQKYGINRGRYHVTPLLETDYLALNTARPLFADASVRKAVNYALDRRALTLQIGPGAASATDQILPPGMPGFRNVHIYPLDRPTVGRAKALMNGRTGKATLYVIRDPAASAQAIIIQANLKAIGIDVSIKQFPFSTFLTASGRKDAPYDMALVGWSADYVDPGVFINVLLTGRNITPENNINLAQFDDPAYQRQMDASARLTGDGRYAAYARLDAALMRDAAPWAPIANRTARELVSKRVGCYVAQPVFPQLDLAAVCLR
jgi:peptide/nickel transport system substrate-binding protein